MILKKFGRTELFVGQIGFGAWGIGGPAMVEHHPIGWGKVDDSTSVRALQKALDLGINFYDTADFYGFGHSEELIGRTFENRKEVVIATKVGHRLGKDQSLVLDYSKEHIIKACHKSLRRLRRETIDYYQLHSARVFHLQDGECIEALEQLKQEGKIRYWGISLNTFHPEPEADFLINKDLGDGFQLVLNIINQRALPVIRKADKRGYGIIARMPLQFGLLTGKFSPKTTFEKDDHRSFRLTTEVISKCLECLKDVWLLTEKYKISKTCLSLSFCVSFPEISTVIPGIKTPKQAIENTSNIVQLEEKDLTFIRELYQHKIFEAVEIMEKQG